MHRLTRCITPVILACIWGLASAQSSPPINVIQLVNDATVAGNPVPPAQTFTVTSAGSYTVTLTDLQIPSALGSLQLSIATSTKSILVLAQAGVQTVTLQPGTYTAQALATAQAGQFGSFSVQVAPQGGGAALLAYEDAVSPPNSPQTGTSTYSTQFTLTAQQAGIYTLVLTDAAFPTALPSLKLLALPNGVANPTPVSWTPSGGGSTMTPTTGTYTATLAAGTYDLFIVATADSTSTNAGLYSAQLSGGANSVLSTTQPVGLLPAAVNLQQNVPSNENVTFQLADLANPSGLATLEGVLTQGATVVGQLSASGSSSFAATKGAAQVYIWAQPNAGSAGSYAIYVHDTSSALLDIAEPVVSTGQLGYSFPASISTAGQYTLRFADFQVPSPLAGLTALIEQGGVSLGTVTLPANPSVMAQVATGPITVVAFPQLSSASANSLFGLELLNASNNISFQATQGVGAQFSSTPVSITTAGTYVLQATDLKFPAAMQVLAVIVTQGEQLVSQVQGGSAQFQVTSSTAGTYVINVLAELGTGSDYGQYGLQLVVAPPPTVTLTAMPTSITSGQLSTLSWSSTNATSCSASGGPTGGSWGGNIPTSGTQQSGALTQSTSFTVTCTGQGGSANAMAQVTVTAATSSSGGGGALSGGTLLVLLLLAALQVGRRERMRVEGHASTMLHSS